MFKRSSKSSMVKRNAHVGTTPKGHRYIERLCAVTNPFPHMPASLRGFFQILALPTHQVIDTVMVMVNASNMNIQTSQQNTVSHRRVALATLGSTS